MPDPTPLQAVRDTLKSLEAMFAAPDYESGAVPSPDQTKHELLMLRACNAVLFEAMTIIIDDVLALEAQVRPPKDLTDG